MSHPICRSGAESGWHLIERKEHKRGRTEDPSAIDDGLRNGTQMFSRLVDLNKHTRKSFVLVTLYVSMGHIRR